MSAARPTGGAGFLCRGRICAQNVRFCHLMTISDSTGRSIITRDRWIGSRPIEGEPRADQCGGAADPASPAPESIGGDMGSSLTPEAGHQLSDLDPLSAASALVRMRQCFALAIVVEAIGSTGARTGAKAIFNAEGEVIVGWVGGGCAQSTVAHAALECFETGHAQIVDVDLNDEVLGAGMPCGGNMRVYVEPVIPPPVIWVVGRGRIAESISKLGAMMGFEIAVVDSAATQTQFPDARRILGDGHNYASLRPTIEDFVVIATQHRGDHQSLARILTTDVGYIALIASRKRAGLVMDYLRDAGLDEMVISRVHAPCGLELAAKTAEEIALSVISEIVLIRRTRSSGSDVAVLASGALAPVRAESGRTTAGTKSVLRQN